MTNQEKWLKLLENWKQGTPLPPCPSCGGEMKSWDAWLVTGETCAVCEWSSCEGSGCLV